MTMQFSLQMREIRKPPRTLQVTAARRGGRFQIAGVRDRYGSEPMRTRRVFLISAVALAALFAGTSIPLAASMQPGGSGLGFSCDVNTQQCKCQGIETGADCVAMKKNCAGKLTCIDPVTYPGQTARCFCNMSQAARPQAIRPKITETLKLAPKQ
ncbi:MAG: hypothetical protein MUE79_03060 [Nitratireductor sp.]|nr:hypothetical protein [Nitratireductor sp.]